MWRLGLASLASGEVVCLELRGGRVVPITATAKGGFSVPAEPVTQSVVDAAEEHGIEVLL
jgi:hypothetical protein